MKRTTIMLLAIATFAISSCSKSTDTSAGYAGTPNHYVPYWGNNQMLSANGGADKMTLNTVTTPVVLNGAVVWETITSHILYNEHDYTVTNIDSGSNAAVDPSIYGGHKISISGNGQTYSGTYQMTVVPLSNNTSSAQFVLVINSGGQATDFGNTMYTGVSAVVPGF